MDKFKNTIAHIIAGAITTLFNLLAFITAVLINSVIVTGCNIPKGALCILMSTWPMPLQLIGEFILIVFFLFIGHAFVTLNKIFYKDVLSMTKKYLFGK